jgi:hypothetical protein
MTLTPAYGRDYKSQAAALADFEAGKDFIIADFTSPWDGKPANKQSMIEAGIGRVQIRYSRLTKVFSVKVKP